MQKISIFINNSAVDVCQRVRLCNLIYGYSYVLNIDQLTVISSIKALSEKVLAYQGSSQTVNEITSILKFVKRNFYLLDDQPVIVYALAISLIKLIRRGSGILEDYSIRLLVQMCLESSSNVYMASGSLLEPSAVPLV